MLAALGAVSTIFDALKSLSSSTSTSASAQTTTGFTQATASFQATTSASTAASLPVSGNGASGGNLSPDTLKALLAAQAQSGATSSDKSRSDALNDLFGLLDGDGNGAISKSEFENALGAGGTNVVAADNVFTRMDKDGDGTVSSDELASALSGSRRGHGHHRHAGGGNADPLMQALSGASTTTTGNSDGSSTTTVTYADGSKVTLTTPASNATSSTASSSYNVVEQAIQRQAQAIAASAAASVSVSA